MDEARIGERAVNRDASALAARSAHWCGLGWTSVNEATRQVREIRAGWTLTDGPTLWDGLAIRSSLRGAAPSAGAGPSVVDH